MSVPKKSITLERTLEGSDAPEVFKVVLAINTLTPTVGCWISYKDAQDLIRSGVKVTIKSA